LAVGVAFGSHGTDLLSQSPHSGLTLQCSTERAKAYSLGTLITGIAIVVYNAGCLGLRYITKLVNDAAVPRDGEEGVSVDSAAEGKPVGLAKLEREAREAGKKEKKKEKKERKAKKDKANGWGDVRTQLPEFGQRKVEATTRPPGSGGLPRVAAI